MDFQDREKILLIVEAHPHFVLCWAYTTKEKENTMQIW